MTWEFGVNDAETVEKWTEATVRDGEKMITFAPFMTSQTEGAVRNPEVGNAGGIIKVHTEFAGKDKAGRTLTIYNVADIPASERGVHGDGLLRDTGADLDTYTMQLRFENVAEQVRTMGELNEKGPLLQFRQTAREKLARYVRAKTEGAIILQLWGLTSWNNTTKLKHWSQQGQESSVFGNTIQAFDADHIVYAGDATSNATIGTDDVMTAQLLTKLETKALEDLDIPLEPLNDELILFCSNRAAEQLLYDEDFIRVNADANTRGSDNPIVRRSIGKFGMIRVVPIPYALNPAANVGQAVLCGKDALQMAKVEDWSWFEDFEDNRKRRKVISVGGTFGVAATYINSTRRNALAVRHYQRS